MFGVGPSIAGKAVVNATCSQVIDSASPCISALCETRRFVSLSFVRTINPRGLCVNVNYDTMTGWIDRVEPSITRTAPQS